MLNLTEKTEALAERIAQAKQVGVEEVVRSALEAKARAEGLLVEPGRPPRDTSPEAIAARRARTEKLLAEFAALPVLDPRSPREIMDDLNSP